MEQLFKVLSGLLASLLARKGGESVAVTGIKNIDMIKKYEDLRLKAYLPTPHDVWTVGWGHTSGAFKGQVITTEQAEEFLRKDLAWVTKVISDAVKVPLTQMQYDALASFIFNIGGPSFHTSTMLQKLNAYDFVGASKEFPRWNKQKGKILNGLITRRALEQEYFLRGTQV